MDNYLFSVLENENFIDLVLYQCGWEQCIPAHSCGPIAKSHYLFHYVISGTGTWMRRTAMESPRDILFGRDRDL